MNLPSDQRAATPVSIKKVGEARLEITWDDEHFSAYPAQYLRQHCPCAACVDEWTGEKRNTPEAIPADLKIIRIDIVGQYALNFTWSDGHNTGIYSFQSLRALCPCDDCPTQSTNTPQRREERQV